MKILSKHFIGGIFLILIGGTLVFAQTEKQIDAIKKIYAETGEKIKECEENGEYSLVFLSQFSVNKNSGSYPAVGIFNSVFKFYYTYGDREKNPYPDRLLKINVETKRSNRVEYSEYLFDPAGKLIFYFEKNDADAERRVYFSAEKPIRSLSGEKAANLNSREEIEMVKAILKEKGKLALMFQNSLRY